jgi:RNA polymerase sigma-70 factor (sigma-E family)
MVVGWDTQVDSAGDALSDLYQLHAVWLVGLIEVMVGDHAAAEDVVQEAFVRVYRAWPRLREPERAVGYLRTTALNIARSGFRRRMVALRHQPALPRDVQPAEEAAVLRDEQRQVIQALRLLPTRQRECLVLRFYGELSEIEIATTLGISNNSVKTHTRRGLAALEARLGADR